MVKHKIGHVCKQNIALVKYDRVKEKLKLHQEQIVKNKYKNINNEKLNQKLILPAIH